MTGSQVSWDDRGKKEKRKRKMGCEPVCCVCVLGLWVKWVVLAPAAQVVAQGLHPTQDLTCRRACLAGAHGDVTAVR